MHEYDHKSPNATSIIKEVATDYWLSKGILLQTTSRVLWSVLFNIFTYITHLENLSLFLAESYLRPAKKRSCSNICNSL